jgi:tetratricopeptide (TPR) repeat protein
MSANYTSSPLLSSRTTLWFMALLFVVCFTLATKLALGFQHRTGNSSDATDLLGVLMGDSRRLFASQFFVEADVALHGGYYPSIFDEVAPSNKLKIASQDKVTPEPGVAAEQADEHAQAGHEGHEEHGDLPEFMKEPRNWIERFGRNFYPAEHRHLDKPREAAEILPWLWMSAELDPHRIETYTVTAFWLRKRLGRVKEAEDFLRAGLRANPDSVEILFELGRVFYEDRQDVPRSRNVWEAALRKWREQAARQAQPDRLLLASIVTRLADLEEKEGHTEPAVHYLELLKSLSPNPGAIQKNIDELRPAKPSPGATPAP